ncbi:MAG: COG4315 family predicted lipoprotein [Candidatus Dormibacteraceae bacterium]
MKPSLMLLLAPVALAACGGTITNQTGAPSAGTPAYSVRVANSSLGPILTDGRGRTLYYYSVDQEGRIACVGACAINFPPLLDDSAPTATDSLGSKLTIVMRLDGGDQVRYNDRPLYTFAGDKKPGDTTGQGIGGEWFVATPSLTDPETAGGQPVAAPTAAPAPGFNDHDSDNNGSPSDGDGNG